MSWLKRLAAVIVLLFIALPVIMYGMVSTTTGSHFLLSQALKFAPIEVSYDELNGALIDELRLKNLVIKTSSQRFTTTEFKLKWSPFELLEKQLIIDELILDQSSVHADEANDKIQSSVELPTIKLPFDVRIRQLSLNGVGIQIGSAPSSESIYQLHFEAGVKLANSKLNLNDMRLEFTQPEFTLHHNGQASARLSGNYPIELVGDYTLNLNDSRLPQIDGNIHLNGALQGAPIEVSSTFKTPNTPSQKLEAQLTSVLSSPSWQADLILNQLPLTIVKPWLKGFPDLSESFITPTSILSGRALIEADKLQLRDVTIANLGEDGGIINVAGEWRHDNFTNYQQSPFQLRLNYKNLNYHNQQLTLKVLSGSSSISGTLNDYTFNNHLELALNIPEQLAIDRVQTDITGVGSPSGINISTLRLISNKLSLNGTLQASWQPALNVDLHVASGRSVIGPDNSEVLLKGDLELKNNELRFRDFALALDNTELTLNGSTARDSLHGRLVVPDLQQVPYLPDGLSELQALETSFTIDTREQLTEFALIFEQFELQTASLDSWLLTTPAKLSLVHKNTAWLGQLEPLCLQHDSNQFGVLCTELRLDDESIVVNLAGERLSLWLLNRFRERDVAQRIAGLVALEAKATLNRETFEIRDVSMALSSDNTVFFALNQETSTRLSYWELTARGNAEAITADLEGQLANDEGGLFGDLKVKDLYGARQIEGNLLFSLDDLAMLDWVLPGMRYHGGKATAQLNLTGTLNEPSLNGDMEVYAESVVFAETNFVFNDVRLALIDRAESEGTLEIEGQAKAGDDGWLLVEGVAMPLDAEAYLRITGKNFRALQMPTATVDISPDLTLHVKQRAIDIAGTVDVPYANISAPDFETSVGNSNDVVITRDGEPVNQDKAEEDGLQVNAQIRVTLGQKVSVDAYGFTGRLIGSLEVVEEPRRPTTAIGSIKVAEGSYELYGQELTIDRGAFIYNGGDISNPGLDLRVRREISNSNNIRNVTVGAQVMGTLTEPDFRLYSTPAMPDSEILSYLILGKSMQSASATNTDDIQLQALLMLGAKGTGAIGESLQTTFGIDEFGIDNDPNTRETSFYIGKYLSPKLFVRYGVGLLESTNTFMVRYQLTERLLIETMASSQAQGGDIFYTFER